MSDWSTLASIRTSRGLRRMKTIVDDPIWVPTLPLSWLIWPSKGATMVAQPGFGHVNVDNKDVLESFNPDDAQRFVIAVRARQRERGRRS